MCVFIILYDHIKKNKEDVFQRYHVKLNVANLYSILFVSHRLINTIILLLFDELIANNNFSINSNCILPW